MLELTLPAFARPHALFVPRAHFHRQLERPCVRIVGLGHIRVKARRHVPPVLLVHGQLPSLPRLVSTAMLELTHRQERLHARPALWDHGL